MEGNSIFCDESKDQKGKKEKEQVPRNWRKDPRSGRKGGEV